MTKNDLKIILLKENLKQNLIFPLLLQFFLLISSTLRQNRIFKLNYLIVFNILV